MRIQKRKYYEKYNLLATCAAGIEAITGNELKHLGYQVAVENGRVRYQGTAEDIINTNLWLRTIPTGSRSSLANLKQRLLMNF